MNKPKPKLLAKNSVVRLKTGLKDSPFTSRTKRHKAYSNNSMGSEARPLRKSMKDDHIVKGYKQERKEYYQQQMLNEAITLENIAKRAPKLLKEGKIRIVPGSVQVGPGTKVVRWSEHRNVPSLPTVLSDPHTTKERKKELYLDLARQIGYLHSVAKYVHNDLGGKKNSNIIIWDGKNPYLVDWGTSRDLTVEDTPHERMGKDVGNLIGIFEEYLGPRDLKEGLHQYLDIAKGNGDYESLMHKIKQSSFMLKNKRYKLLASANLTKV